MRMAEITGIRLSRSGQLDSQSQRNVVVPKPAVRFVDRGLCGRQPGVVERLDVEAHRLQVREIDDGRKRGHWLAPPPGSGRVALGGNG